MEIRPGLGLDVVVISPGKTRETFFNEARTHRGNEGMTAPLKKLPSVGKPTETDLNIGDRSRGSRLVRGLKVV